MSASASSSSCSLGGDRSNPSQSSGLRDRSNRSAMLLTGSNSASIKLYPRTRAISSSVSACVVSCSSPRLNDLVANFNSAISRFIFLRRSCSVKYLLSSLRLRAATSRLLAGNSASLSSLARAEIWWAARCDLDWSLLRTASSSDE